MDAAIRTTPPGPKIVMGASGTTVVVDEEMRRLANDPTAPPADELSFVVMGDANRGIFKAFQGVKLPIFDYTPVVPETKYDVMVIKGEYDAIGDWPDRSWNLLADLNALAASGLLQQIIPEEIVKQFSLESWGGSVHKDAMFVDPSTVPARNITTTTNALGGTTTTYLMRTADLPLLRPLKGMGWPQPVIDGLTAVLRPIVDSAYYRNDPPHQLAATSARPGRHRQLDGDRVEQAIGNQGRGRKDNVGEAGGEDHRQGGQRAPAALRAPTSGANPATVDPLGTRSSFSAEGGTNGVASRAVGNRVGRGGGCDQGCAGTSRTRTRRVLGAFRGQSGQ